jgi:uncharacterized pyridoxamine 5'-phosphate oxidase family protein
MKEVYEFLKEAKTYFLATEEGAQPHVRPFGTVNLFENRIYIQTGKKKNVAAQIAKNPKVEICAVIGGRWLRVTATLVEDPRLSAQEDMLKNYPELAGMYKAGDGNNVVYCLSDATATFFSFTEAPRTVKF